MELIPAPGRQLKTVSFWLITILILADTALALVAYFGELHLLSAPAVTTINALLGALILIAKQYQQQIAVTPEQKVAMVEAAAAAPVKAGHVDPQIAVTVNNPPQPKA